MESLLTGIALSFLAGLGWLSCHQPSQTFKLIGGCLGICAFLHIGAYVYKKAWQDSTKFIETRIKSIRPSHGIKGKQLARVKHRLAPVFTSSPKQLGLFWDYWNARFCTAYVVLVCLLFFCWTQQK